MRNVTLALLLLSIPAHASSRRHTKYVPMPIRIEATIGAEQVDYANTHFDANPSLGGRPVGHLSLLGKQFDAKTPKFVDMSLRVEGITHHVVIGAAFGLLYSPLGGAPGSGRVSGDDPAGGAVQTSTIATDSYMMGFYSGATIGTAWTWKSFDMAFTTTMGYRSVDIGLRGFDLVPCKGGKCEPDATSQAFFAQPRLSLGIHHNSWGMGGYIGAELTTAGSGWATGAYFEAADSLFRRRASAIDPDTQTNPPSYP